MRVEVDVDNCQTLQTLGSICILLRLLEEMESESANPLHHFENLVIGSIYARSTEHMILRLQSAVASYESTRPPRRFIEEMQRYRLPPTSQLWVQSAAVRTRSQPTIRLPQARRGPILLPATFADDVTPTATSTSSGSAQVGLQIRKERLEPTQQPITC